MNEYEDVETYDKLIKYEPGATQQKISFLTANSDMK